MSNSRQRQHNVVIRRFWHDNNSLWLHLVYLFRWQPGTKIDLCKNNPNANQWQTAELKMEPNCFSWLRIVKENLCRNTSHLFGRKMIIFLWWRVCHLLSFSSSNKIFCQAEFPKQHVDQKMTKSKKSKNPVKQNNLDGATLLLVSKRSNFTYIIPLNL